MITAKTQYIALIFLLVLNLLLVLFSDGTSTIWFWLTILSILIGIPYLLWQLMKNK